MIPELITPHILNMLIGIGTPQTLRTPSPATPQMLRRNQVAAEDLYYPHPLIQDVLWWTLYKAERESSKRGHGLRYVTWITEEKCWGVLLVTSSSTLFSCPSPQVC